MSALYALLGLAVLFLIIGAWRRDSTRQRSRRTRLVALSVASRASRLEDCPDEFMVKLAAALHLEHEEVIQ